MGLLGGSKPNNSIKRGHVPLDVDGYPVAPPELELEQVHIYVRHGERTPVGVRMADPPANIPEHWMFCNTARQFRAAVASATAEEGQVASFPAVQSGPAVEELRARRIVERRDGTAAVGECLLGELTDVGRESTYHFGTALRKLYIDRLKFLPDVVHSNDEIYLRSTNMPRTIESLQQITHGLYPMTKHAKDFVPLLRIRNGKDENLFGNTLACKRLEILQVGFAHAAAAAWNSTLEPLDKKISKYIGGNPVRLDGKPRASGILDTIRAAEAHGVDVPPEFKEKGVIDLIEKAVVTEWFAGCETPSTLDRTEEVRRLGMGPLLSDLSEKMQAKAEKGGIDPTKILIHSTHDTCLAGLSNTLDIFDEKWPAFTAAITFELFKKRATNARPASPWQNVLSLLGRSQDNTEHYVRVRYQNQNKPLPHCAEEGKHLPGSPEFCTLAAFRERVQELTPDDWEAECAYTPVNKQKEREEAQAAAAQVIAKPQLPADSD
ncbi:phosphoglycerate mutase-like protein [Trametes coccinea BRFM310]|uniref:Phosphoglycerate mutase-like protein n=1 Tax=Trametes coccinea (strain BRFM310) TaxID=1353009 RepID=A0A1Y2J5R1_TRAC3|nr:phosphoglycerate mutase-like protein [Trametes coccinea BRFM310]